MLQPSPWFSQLSYLSHTVAGLELTLRNLRGVLKIMIGVWGGLESQGKYRHLKIVSMLSRSYSVYTGHVCMKTSNFCKCKCLIQLKEISDIIHFLCKLQVQLKSNSNFNRSVKNMCHVNTQICLCTCLCWVAMSMEIFIRSINWDKKIIYICLALHTIVTFFKQ